MKIKPLGNHVLVKRSKAAASKGGILLPDSAKEKPKEGQVIAVGPGKVDDSGKLAAMQISVGKRVLFSAYAGTEVQSDNQDEQYLILAEEDVLCILEESK